MTDPTATQSDIEAGLQRLLDLYVEYQEQLQAWRELWKPKGQGLPVLDIQHVEEALHACMHEYDTDLKPSAALAYRKRDAFARTVARAVYARARCMPKEDWDAICAQEGPGLN